MEWYKIIQNKINVKYVKPLGFRNLQRASYDNIKLKKNKLIHYKALKRH